MGNLKELGITSSRHLPFATIQRGDSQLQDKSSLFCLLRRRELVIINACFLLTENLKHFGEETRQPFSSMQGHVTDCPGAGSAQNSCVTSARLVEQGDSHSANLCRLSGHRGSWAPSGAVGLRPDSNNTISTHGQAGGALGGQPTSDRPSGALQTLTQTLVCLITGFKCQCRGFKFQLWNHRIYWKRLVRSASPTNVDVNISNVRLAGFWVIFCACSCAVWKLGELSFPCNHTHPGDEALQILDELDISETAKE